MRPPLMAEFVSGDEVGKVDVGGLEHASDEADAFRVRNSVREGLREYTVAWEFVDTELLELVRAIDALIVVESVAGAGEHAIDVESVGGIVVHLERDVVISYGGSGGICARGGYCSRVVNL